MIAPPRVPLAALPTPLARAVRLEREVGCGPFYVKRDDLTGFGVAGNKARKMETMLADALEANADVIVTGGGPGSNHCAAAAAAAAVTGLACELVVYGDGAEHVNLSLARSWGARVLFTGDDERGSVDRGLASAAARLRAEGRRPYVIPRGGATPLGAAAYALAAGELAAQLERQAVERPTVVVAAGSCGTLGGLVAGAAGRGWKMVGVAVSRPLRECRERTLTLARAACARLGSEPVTADDVTLRDARGPAYGIASEDGARAAALAARTEGLLLDPVFTAKAFAVALDLARTSAPIVFVHTGGVAAALWSWRPGAGAGEPAGG